MTRIFPVLLALLSSAFSIEATNAAVACSMATVGDVPLGPTPIDY